MGNRKHERKPVSVQVVVAFDDAADTGISGELVDISPGGAGVVLEHRPEKAETLLANNAHLLVLRPEYRRIGRIPIEAIWVTAHPQGPHLLRSGFRFSDDPGVACRVEELIAAVPGRLKPLFE